MSNVQKVKDQLRESSPVFEEILQRAAATSPRPSVGRERSAAPSDGQSQKWHGVEEHLTPREIDVLKLIARGNSSRNIAQRLGITFRTARTHRSNLMDKLNMHETSALVRHAIRIGLIRA